MDDRFRNRGKLRIKTNLLHEIFCPVLIIILLWNLFNRTVPVQACLQAFWCKKRQDKYYTGGTQPHNSHFCLFWSHDKHVINYICNFETLDICKHLRLLTRLVFEIFFNKRSFVYYKTYPVRYDTFTSVWNRNMNTVLSRLNTIFAFTLSVMAALTFLCFLSTFFNEHKANVSIDTGKVVV